MPMFRKVMLLGDAELLSEHPTGKIRILAGESYVQDNSPKITLYSAPGENAPPDILDLLSKCLIHNGRIRARNPATYGEYFFAITVSAAAVRIITTWLKARKGRKIEIRKGNMRV